MCAKIMNFQLLVPIFLLLYLCLVQSENYCNNALCKQRDVSCNEQPEIPARHCIDYEKTIKTERDKQAILNKINSRRNKVAMGDIRSFAAAGNMIKLKWSEQLELAAQRWADQCVGQNMPDIKDPCLDIDSEGQNIATIYGEAPGLSPLVLVDVWYMELLHMNISIVSQYKPSTETGLSHYDYFTQLVWAESNYVGCGSVKFKEPRKDGKLVIYRTVNRLVCNFTPAGNRRLKPVYVKRAPCSLCPEDGCDYEYKALCILKGNTQNTITMLPELNDSTASVFEATQVMNETYDDDSFMPYNYFGNLFKSSSGPGTVSSTNSQQCKDMAVDDFVELLKKKLSSDPMFKDLASKSYSQTGDVTNTDPNVAAFVSKVYSKKIPSTTSKSTANDFINSTLLVDLVEAVIFRSGDKIPSNEESDKNIPTIQVDPIKIKAELSEVKLNQGFTGHYFFPEDDDNNEDINSETTEMTESYDDISPMPDVILEIGDIKLIKTTKDFLEDILESESVSESMSTPTVMF